MQVADRQAFSSTSLGASTVESGDRLRQAWARSLEQAGVENALKATNVVRSGVRLPTPESASSHNADPGPERLSLDDTDFVGRRVSKSNLKVGPDADCVVPRELQARVSGLSERVDEDLCIPSRTQNRADVLGGLGEGVGNNDLAPSRGLQVFGDWWAARKTTLLPCVQGLELVIRDAHISDAELVNVVSSTRSALSSIGKTLVRISLNGKAMPKQLPVFQSYSEPSEVNHGG